MAHHVVTHQSAALAKGLICKSCCITSINIESIYTPGTCTLPSSPLGNGISAGNSWTFTYPFAFGSRPVIFMYCPINSINHLEFQYLPRCFTSRNTITYEVSHLFPNSKPIFFWRSKHKFPLVCFRFLTSFLSHSQLFQILVSIVSP